MTWPSTGNSPLFQSSGLKRAGEELTSADLEEQYGFMTDTVERAHRQQSQVLGRPLTRAEQRGLAKQFHGFEIDIKKLKITIAALATISIFVPVIGYTILKKLGVIGKD